MSIPPRKYTVASKDNVKAFLDKQKIIDKTINICKRDENRYIITRGILFVENIQNINKRLVEYCRTYSINPHDIIKVSLDPALLPLFDKDIFRSSECSSWEKYQKTNYNRGPVSYFVINPHIEEIIDTLKAVFPRLGYGIKNIEFVPRKVTKEYHSRLNEHLNYLVTEYNCEHNRVNMKFKHIAVVHTKILYRIVYYLNTQNPSVFHCQTCLGHPYEFEKNELEIVEKSFVKQETLEILLNITNSGNCTFLLTGDTLNKNVTCDTNNINTRSDRPNYTRLPNEQLQGKLVEAPVHFAIENPYQKNTKNSQKEYQHEQNSRKIVEAPANYANSYYRQNHRNNHKDYQQQITSGPSKSRDYTPKEQRIKSVQKPSINLDRLENKILDIKERQNKPIVNDKKANDVTGDDIMKNPEEYENNTAIETPMDTDETNNDIQNDINDTNLEDLDIDSDNEIDKPIYPENPTPMEIIEYNDKQKPYLLQQHRRAERKKEKAEKLKIIEDKKRIKEEEQKKIDDDKMKQEELTNFPSRATSMLQQILTVVTKLDSDDNKALKKRRISESTLNDVMANSELELAQIELDEKKTKIMILEETIEKLKKENEEERLSLNEVIRSTNQNANHNTINPCESDKLIVNISNVIKIKKITPIKARWLIFNEILLQISEHADLPHYLLNERNILKEISTIMEEEKKFKNDEKNIPKTNGTRNVAKKDSDKKEKNP